jgi:hypothetical protein
MGCCERTTSSLHTRLRHRHGADEPQGSGAAEQQDHIGRASRARLIRAGSEYERA